jgi:hypothetical protein
MCPTRMAGVVDVIYVNIVTCNVGRERMGELGKGGQLLTDQGLEWMGIRATSKEASSPSK